LLDNAEDFIAALEAKEEIFERDSSWAFSDPEDVYCPVCGGPRRASMRLLYWRKLSDKEKIVLAVEDPTYNERGIAERFGPIVALMTCLQCRSESTALLFEGPNGYELAVFPKVHGGLSTPHTPKAVAYYLDQAKRAQSVGANTAAVAMYRSALEHLLFDEGYKDRMLGPKIAALLREIEAGTAKQWARDLRSEYLTVIKKLGDAAIHPGDGTVERQQALDNALLRQLEITFAGLLAVVYEREHEEAERLEALKRALASVEENAESGDS
jgi:Domain of unknown function (DUF4145)